MPTQPANAQVLVTYASRAGSTAEVAQAVTAQLCTHGYRVDVRPIDEVDDLRAYDRVVVGSAIRMGQWLPAAIKFMAAHKAELGAKPTAFFTVHLNNMGDDEASRQARAAYLVPVHAHLTPAHEAFFAGKMDFAKLTWLDRFIAKRVGATEVDLRDWQAIRTWADQVALS